MKSTFTSNKPTEKYIPFAEACKTPGVYKLKGHDIGNNRLVVLKDIQLWVTDSNIEKLYGNWTEYQCLKTDEKFTVEF